MLIENQSRELYYSIHAATGNKLIVHIWTCCILNIVASNMVQGISPIDVKKNTTDFDNAVRTFNLTEMQNQILLCLNMVPM